MIRRYNAERFVNDFQRFKQKYVLELQKALVERRKLKFVPSKPSYQDAIEKLLDMKNRFNDHHIPDSVHFATSIQKCFVDVGCVSKALGSDEFNLYDTSLMDTTGTSVIKPIGLGSVISGEVEVAVAVAVETLLDEDIDVFDEVSNLDPDEAMDDILSIIDDDDYEDWNSVAEDAICDIDEADIDLNDIGTDDDDDENSSQHSNSTLDSTDSSGRNTKLKKSK
jgi:hypothetical protein